MSHIWIVLCEAISETPQMDYTLHSQWHNYTEGVQRASSLLSGVSVDVGQTKKPTAFNLTVRRVRKRPELGDPEVVGGGWGH